MYKGNTFALLLAPAGHLVYHGPREHVMEFFEGLGFACPERKGIADFLQEVTSRKDQKVWCNSFFRFSSPGQLWMICMNPRYVNESLTAFLPACLPAYHVLDQLTSVTAGTPFQK